MAVNRLFQPRIYRRAPTIAISLYPKPSRTQIMAHLSIRLSTYPTPPMSTYSHVYSFTCLHAYLFTYLLGYLLISLFKDVAAPSPPAPISPLRFHSCYFPTSLRSNTNTCMFIRPSQAQSRVSCPPAICLPVYALTRLPICVFPRHSPSPASSSLPFVHTKT